MKSLVAFPFFCVVLVIRVAGAILVHSFTITHWLLYFLSRCLVRSRCREQIAPTRSANRPLVCALRLYRVYATTSSGRGGGSDCKRWRRRDAAIDPAAGTPFEEVRPERAESRRGEEAVPNGVEYPGDWSAYISTREAGRKSKFRERSKK